jgi:hypothetical protein
VLKEAHNILVIYPWHSGHKLGIICYWHGYGIELKQKHLDYLFYEVLYRLQGTDSMRFLYAITLLVTFSLISLGKTVAQSAEQVLNEVTESLIDGDSDRLAKHFKDQVEVTLLGRRQILSKAQATYVLKQFFGDYPPVSFNRGPVGETGGTMYARCEYRSGRGNFEVNIFIMMGAGSSKVNGLKFERTGS